MDGLNWGWIGIMATVPLFVGAVVAIPFWRQSEPIFGNLVGTVVIFGSGLALIFREYYELDLLTRACIEAGSVCFPSPSAFARYAVYACIALAEVFALFAVSIAVERRIRNRLYAPEWR